MLLAEMTAYKLQQESLEMIGAKKYLRKLEGFLGPFKERLLAYITLLMRPEIFHLDDWKRAQELRGLRDCSSGFLVLSNVHVTSLAVARKSFFGRCIALIGQVL